MSKNLSKLLYVEDEPDIRNIAKLVLENVGGFELQTAEGGKQALEILQTFKPDMILLDAMMPEMDGPATFRAIRGLSEFQQTPIAFLTAKLLESDIQAFLDMGAVGVLGKPFDPMTLSDKVRELWSKI